MRGSAGGKEGGEFALDFAGEGFGNEFAVPAVGAELREELGSKRTAIAGGQVGFDVGCFAHARDGGGYVGIGKNEAEGQFGEREAIAEQRLEGFDALQRVAEIFAGEIIVAPIAGWPSADCGQGAGERALVERNTGDDGDIFSRQAGKSSSSGFWSKAL